MANNLFSKSLSMQAILGGKGWTPTGRITKTPRQDFFYFLIGQTRPESLAGRLHDPHCTINPYLYIHVKPKLELNKAHDGLITTMCYINIQGLALSAVVTQRHIHSRVAPLLIIIILFVMVWSKWQGNG